MQEKRNRGPISRRELLQVGGAATLAVAAAGPAALFGAASQPPELIIDAMGEIRDVYDPPLVREILASGLDAIFVTLCDPKTFEAEAMAAAMDGIRSYDRYLGAHPDLYLKATSVADVERARTEGKLAVLYLFQTSTQFGRDLDRVDHFYDLGVRSSQITYNYQNWAGAGCKEVNGSGLTSFGHELVEKMNAVGMLIDLSHANMRTMADTIRASSVPVAISHTACMAVYENVRNTTDDNLRLLAEHGGVVGICQIRPFVTDVRDGAFEHYLDHIEHAIDVAGSDHVAIGSDRDHRVIELSEEYLAELAAEEGANFDPKDWPLFMDELNGPRRMEVVWQGLVRRGLSESTIDKVMGLNLKRLYLETIG
jgi:membrane dipeptidase